GAAMTVIHAQEPKARHPQFALILQGRGTKETDGGKGPAAGRRYKADLNYRKRHLATLVLEAAQVGCAVTGVEHPAWRVIRLGTLGRVGQGAEGRRGCRSRRFSLA